LIGKGESRLKRSSESIMAGDVIVAVSPIDYMIKIKTKERLK
jgi:hypothetical protein